MNIDDEKPTYSGCTRKGNDEDHCWKLHPELKSKWAKLQKGKKNIVATIQDLDPTREINPR